MDCTSSRFMQTRTMCTEIHEKMRRFLIIFMMLMTTSSSTSVASAASAASAASGTTSIEQTHQRKIGGLLPPVMATGELTRYSDDRMFVSEWGDEDPLHLSTTRGGGGSSTLVHPIYELAVGSSTNNNEYDDDDLQTGAIVSVFGYRTVRRRHLTDTESDGYADGRWFSNSDRWIPLIRVEKVLILRPAVRDLTPTITSVTFVTKICDQAALTPTQVDAVRKRWATNTSSASASPTPGSLSDLYRICSWNRTSFSPASNIFVDLTAVNVPCTGQWQGQPWQWGSCGNTELQGWQAWIEDYATNVLNMDLSRYSRRVLIIPYAPTCPWSGLATLGCGTLCRVWLQGPYTSAGSIHTAFHELGHTLGMKHSSTPTLEYGDKSCAMGGCCNERCFNAPQSWSIGWVDPIRSTPVNESGLASVGSWAPQFGLMAQEVSNVSTHLRVSLSSRMSSTLFLSYRVSISNVWPYASGVPAAFLGLNVHAFNGTRTTPTSKAIFMGSVNTPQRTVEVPFDLPLSPLTPPDSPLARSSSLVVQLVSFTNERAVARLCLRPVDGGGCPSVGQGHHTSPLEELM